MRTTIISAGLLVAAVINLLPLVGVLSRERLRELYDLEVDSPGLEVLLRHRAVLFGIVGGLLVAAAFVPPLQVAAITAGFVSMLSFIALTRTIAGAAGIYRRIVIADLMGSAALVMSSAALIAG